MALGVAVVAGLVTWYPVVALTAALTITVLPVRSFRWRFGVAVVLPFVTGRFPGQTVAWMSTAADRAAIRDWGTATVAAMFATELTYLVVTGLLPRR